MPSRPTPNDFNYPPTNSSSSSKRIGPPVLDCNFNLGLLLSGSLSHLEGTPAGFSADVTILYASVGAEAIISVVFGIAAFSASPLSMDSSRHDGRVVYGPIQRDAVLRFPVERCDSLGQVFCSLLM
ncbi:hypothetical protein EDD15DRAFT_2530370 [Pisolithus albus]|nr:hypothetical protein EDD15DRAFT_2530370 [Pisolithus albus]